MRKAAPKKLNLVRGKEPTIMIRSPIKARLMHDFKRYGNGSIAMSFADTEAKVVEKESGKVIGSVTAAIGGHIIIHINPDGDGERGRAWTISPLDLFNAVSTADIEQYPIEEPKPNAKRHRPR